MGAQYVVLNKEQHQTLKIIPGFSLGKIVDEHLIPITINEFQQASSQLPIVFVKNSETGDFESVVVTGLEKGENLCVSNGQWQNSYVPEVIQRIPFGLSVNPQDDEQLLVAIDEESDLLSHIEGESLFDQSGEESEYLSRRKQNLLAFHDGKMYGKLFIKRLVELKLLEATSLSLKLETETRQLGGIYVVNPKNLNKISDKNLAMLRDSNELMAIYAHMISLQLFQRLIELKSKK